MSEAPGDNARIAKRAIYVDNADVDELFTAGGRPIGTLTYRTGDWSMDSIRDFAADEAAKRGGTHFTLGKQKAGKEYEVSPSAGGYVVREQESSNWTVQLLVVMVPRGGWGSLSEELRPAAVD